MDVHVIQGNMPDADSCLNRAMQMARQCNNRSTEVITLASCLLQPARVAVAVAVAAVSRLSAAEAPDTIHSGHALVRLASQTAQHAQFYTVHNSVHML